ncbi:MAG: hypothetical protein KOO65_08540 [Desulfobacterales bacterium]|nr:hypothetical protein [Desulfobacterales bacterium]
MAVDYTDIFSKIGVYVCMSNRMLDVQTLIASDYVEAALDEYATSESEQTIGLTESFISSATGLEETIGLGLTYVDEVLASLKDELIATTTDSDEILNLLNLRMIEDSETINANVITTPSVSATGNTGDGTVLASVVNIDGNDAEGIFDEVVQFRCTSDRFTGSVSPTFSVAGKLEFSRTSWRPLGNGSDTASASIGSNLISNGDFESWTLNEPESWTIDAGAALIQIEETNQYRGDSCLLLEADSEGTLGTTIATLTQNLSLDKNTIYCMTVRLKDQNEVDGTSNLAIFIDTENETLSSPIEVFSANPSTLAGTWQLYSVFFSLPATRDEDQLTVFIDWTDSDTVTIDKQILIDDLIIAPAFIFGNVAYNIVPGATDWIIDDYVDVTTANSRDAVFQNFFTRYYDKQLNSAGAGAETIDDALATVCPSICASGT